jgi:hypothetical protein
LLYVLAMDVLKLTKNYPRTFRCKQQHGDESVSRADTCQDMGWSWRSMVLTPGGCFSNLSWLWELSPIDCARMLTYGVSRRANYLQCKMLASTEVV